MIRSRVAVKPKKAVKLPPPRVRHEPPTLEEAFAAARDLSDDPAQQLEIAAGLMGVPEEEARAHQPKTTLSVARPRSATSLMVRDRVITVERRTARVPRRLPAGS